MRTALCNQRDLPVPAPSCSVTVELFVRALVAEPFQSLPWFLKHGAVLGVLPSADLLQVSHPTEATMLNKRGDQTLLARVAFSQIFREAGERFWSRAPPAVLCVLSGVPLVARGPIPIRVYQSSKCVFYELQGQKRDY